MKKILLNIVPGMQPADCTGCKGRFTDGEAVAGFSGKDVQVLTVEYPPGGRDPIHRHNAHGFIYVLDGSIVMAVNGGQPVTLTAGQTFYEGPNDIHTIGRNASETTPAKFLVFLLKDKDAPVLIPVK